MRKVPEGYILVEKEMNPALKALVIKGLLFGGTLTALAIAGVIGRLMGVL